MVDYQEHPVFMKPTDMAGGLATEELAKIRSLLERLPTSGPVHIERDLGDARLAQTARTILTSRRDIEVKFGALVTNDPSIDLLLTLFVEQARGRMITVSEACAATSAPATTALRRLSLLTAQGLVQRVRHRHDKRTVFVSLTQLATTKMRAYLQATHLGDPI